MPPSTEPGEPASPRSMRGSSPSEPPSSGTSARVVPPPAGGATAESSEPDLPADGNPDKAERRESLPSPPSSEPLGEASRWFFEELARLEAEIAPRRRADRAEPALREGPATARPPPRSDLPADLAHDGLTPYLEERIRIAEATIGTLSRELQEVGRHWDELRGSAELLERELGNAAREARFVRGRTDVSPEGPSSSPPGPPPSLGEPPLDPGTGPLPGGGYRTFTATRYNRAIGALKARRRALAGWTLVLAAAISGTLVVLSLLVPEARPPTWTAVLPAVWIIPVPFFVVSFLGTHRVLRRNHLNLPEGP